MTGQITGWGAALWAATGAALSGLLGWLPRLVGAIVVLLVGWGIASLLEGLTHRGLRAIHFDRWMTRAGVDHAIARSGMRLEPSGIVATLVKWAVFLVAILVAADAMGLPQVTAALNSLVGYIPNVIAAVLILTFGAVLANFAGNLVKAAPLSFSQLLGQVTYWAVMVFAILAALTQLNIAPALIQTLFTAVIGMVAVAGAIAFGLGLRRQAEDLVVSTGLRQFCKQGDTISLPDLDGQTIAGRIETLGPTMTTLRTDKGLLLVPNRMLADHVSCLGATSTRVNVTRMPEAAPGAVPPSSTE